MFASLLLALAAAVTIGLIYVGVGAFLDEPPATVVGLFPRSREHASARTPLVEPREGRLRLPLHGLLHGGRNGEQFLVR